jgi:hypothetical protein
MAELQRGLWIVKVEEVYDPDFYYRWDLLDNWLPEPLAAAGNLDRNAAVNHLLGAYLSAAGAAQAPFLAGLLGVSRAEVEAGVARLETTGTLRQDQGIHGLPGRWIVWQGDAAE